MAPMVFMPLLRETLPSGPNKIMKNIRMKVFRCKPADDVMRCGTVRRTGRSTATGARCIDADLFSCYANYFTRFMEAVASEEWRAAAKYEALVGAAPGWNSVSAKHWLACAQRRP